MDFIYNFLITLPMWLLYLISFAATYGVDALYTLWTRRTVSGNAKAAGFFSVCIYICSITAFIGIIDVSNELVIPALFGAYLGSYFTVKQDEKKNPNNKKPAHIIFK